MTGTVAGAALAPTDTLAATVKRLASAQKGAARGAPAYSLYVNRPLGRVPAALAFRLGWTPNMVTGLSALASLAGVLVIALVPPSVSMGIAVWLLLAGGYVLDSADGQLARLRGGGSTSGEWLDHVVDAWKISSVHLAVLVLAYRHLDLPDPAWLLVPVIFTIVAAVSFFAMILNDLLKAKHAVEPARNTASTPFRSILGLPTDYGILCLSFALLGLPAVFFGVYTALFAANTLYLVLALVKWFGDMRALGATPAGAPGGAAAPRHRSDEWSDHVPAR
ncbi:CDP-alcohol phosphatidyltransferase family protein [Cryobacterium sp. SO2]|uniref:CDP-alcohol phosphatidyltransferase family protein n=1 Tax=Cryobacterium sp. SO2 TaxID=1897060 RepID=UPI00223E13C1|nr:CDP-alcohol phosphatidyltransferase family protein [Cryobacterium sp. SO2]WEO76939.1 CDP-alcohol phosphatidyltransferase family protein [Cryobacterium sp. SO2]